MKFHWEYAGYCVDYRAFLIFMTTLVYPYYTRIIILVEYAKWEWIYINNSFFKCNNYEVFITFFLLRKNENISFFKCVLKFFFKGSTVEYFITVGMFKTFGIFFVEYQRKYSTTSSVISLVLAVQTIVGSVSCKLDISVNRRKC